MTERNLTPMTNPTDDRPTWTDPAPTTTTPVPAATQPLAPATPIAPATSPAAAASAGAPPPAVPPAVPPAAAGAAVTPVAPVVVTTRSNGGGRWVNVLLGVAMVIAVGGVAFAIGRSTAPASAATVGTFPGGGIAVTPGGSFDPNGGPVVNGGPRGLFGAGGPTIDGKVASVDGDTMTITLPSGDTMTVKTDGDTTYHQSTPATAADVQVGDDVAVRVSGGFRFDSNGGGRGPTATAARGPTATADPGQRRERPRRRPHRHGRHGHAVGGTGR